MHVVIQINPIFQKAHMSNGDKCCGEKIQNNWVGRECQVVGWG